MEKIKRDTETVNKAGRSIHKYSDDYGTCWMCWIQLTDEELIMDPSYSDNEKHMSLCPLCGYEHWIGRRWFPFRYLKWGVIGNPSSRIRPTIKRRRMI